MRRGVITTLLILLITLVTYSVNPRAEWLRYYDQGPIMYTGNLLGGENTMENDYVIEAIGRLLGCSERTAESLFTTLEEVVPVGITDVAMEPDDYFSIIKLTTTSGNSFYVYIGAGYFISQVTEDTRDGKIIYEAME